MADKKIKLRCYHPDCAKDTPTELVVTIPSPASKAGGKKEKLVYCKRNHANMINLPDNWNVNPRSPVYGDDQNGGPDDVPLLQGRKF